jgi:hypothetical protein
VNSSYKLRRKGEKFPGGNKKLAEELETLEVFQAEQSPRKVAQISARSAERGLRGQPKSRKVKLH